MNEAYRKTGRGGMRYVEPSPPSEQAYAVLAVHAMKLQHERDAAMRALELVAEDCESWLAGERDDASAEFIKLVAKFARESQVLERSLVGKK
jgi:hypothetical protein